MESLHRAITALRSGHATEGETVAPERTPGPSGPHALGGLLCLLLLVCACAETEAVTGAVGEEAPLASHTLSAPFDVQAIMHQVHFAYRQEGDAFLAEHTTYTSRVVAGRLSFAAQHMPSPAPETAGAAHGNRRNQAGEDAAVEPVVLRGAPFGMETVGITRGAQALLSAMTGSAIEEDGSLQLRRGAVIESLVNNEEGVEQRWLFARKPEGEGELRVELRVSGQEYVGATAYGLHFRDPVTGVGVRYGAAAWVDGAGHRTPLRTGYERGVVTVHVPHELLERSSYPALLDPLVSPEFGMDRPVTIPNPNEESSLVLARRADGYMLVWTESLSFNFHYILGARIDSQGRSLDPSGIRIGGDVEPRVACDETGGCLVLWQTFVRLGRRGESKVGVSRVSPSGAVLGTLAPSSLSNEQNVGDIAFDGKNYLVVWSNRTAPDSQPEHYAIYAARISPTGTVLDPAGLPITTAPDDQVQPRLAFDGTNYLVVWQNWAGSDGELRGARLSSAGKVIGQAGFAISTAPGQQNSHEVIFAKSDYFVVWSDSRSGSSYDIYGTRVSRAGTVRDPAGIPISRAAGSQTFPKIAAVGDELLAFWIDARRDPASPALYGTRISLDGRVADRDGIMLQPDSARMNSTALAANNERVLVVWTDAFGLRGGLLAPGRDLRLTESRMLSVPYPNAQRNPAVAFDGDNYLVVWEDSRDVPAGVAIFGTRVSRTGRVLDRSGLRLSAAAQTIASPAVAFGKDSFLVVWSQYGDQNAHVFGVQVSRSGQVEPRGGSATLPISTAPGYQVSPAVTYGGGRFLVVWQDDRSEGRWAIYGARVLDTGKLLDPDGLAISPPRQGSLAEYTGPAVTFGDDRFLVVFQGQLDRQTSAVVGARITPGGTLLDRNGIRIHASEAFHSGVTVASDGRDFLVAWNNTSSGEDTAIAAARVTKFGTLRGPAGTIVTVTSRAPRLGFQAPAYLLLWKEPRPSTSVVTLYAASLPRVGSLNIGNRIQLTVSRSDIGWPALAADGCGNYLICYARELSGLPGYAVSRVRGRLFSP